jgi:long-chain acyl-CoA synthetase
LTEASPCLTWNPFDGSGVEGSVGYPIASTDLRIVNNKGKPLPIGKIGELQAAGPQIMKGYYNRPEAT